MAGATDIKFIAWPDTHIPFHDPQAVRCALKILQWYQPDQVILLGDFLDCTPVSHWLLNHKKTTEGMRLEKDFKAGRVLLDKIQQETGKLVYIEGNHEDWIRQAIDRQPEFEGLIDLSVGLRFDERPNFTTMVYGKHYSLGKLWFTHGNYTNQYHARKHVESFEHSVVYGHLHDVQMHIKVSPVDVNDKHMGLSIGCLADKNPQFMRNRPNNWTHCVAVGLVRKDGTFNIDPIIISNGVASYAGVTFDGR